MNEYIEKLELEGVKIIFKNFSGRPTKYNKDGKRSFDIIIEDMDLFSTLEELGWNVILLKKKDEADPDKGHLKVNVFYGRRPPKINIVRNGIITPITEDEVGMLDNMDIAAADVIIRPYRPSNPEDQWTLSNGKIGIAAYLEEAYIIINESIFAEKYRLMQQN